MPVWLNEIDINMFGYFDLNIRFGYRPSYEILKVVEIGDIEILMTEWFRCDI